MPDLCRAWEAGDPRRDRTLVPYADCDTARVVQEAVAQLVVLRAPMWSGDAAAAISVLVSVAAEAESLLFDVVAEARDQGYSWERIAWRLATSAGTARRRYGAYARWPGRSASDGE